MPEGVSECASGALIEHVDFAVVDDSGDVQAARDRVVRRERAVVPVQDLLVPAGPVPQVLVQARGGGRSSIVVIE